MPGKRKKKNIVLRLWAIAFWLIVWQIAAAWLKQEILLPSPVSTFVRLFELVQELSFWQAILFSFVRIIGGFLLACICGVLFAMLSARFSLFEQLISPLITTIKAVPVASFIILTLIWISSKNLSVFIAFLIVLPVIYTSTLEGILHTDHKLLEMAHIFKIPFSRRLRFIYTPEVLPFFRAACSVSLGLCWKAGTAAEVIGIPSGSIGEKLYQAKIFFDTSDLFAWTFVIIFVSIAFEKLFLKLLDYLIGRLERD